MQFDAQTTVFVREFKDSVAGFWGRKAGERERGGGTCLRRLSGKRVGGFGGGLFFVAVAVASLPMAPRTAPSLCASPLQVPIHGRQGVNVN